MTRPVGGRGAFGTRRAARDARSVRFRGVLFVVAVACTATPRALPDASRSAPALRARSVTTPGEDDGNAHGEPAARGGASTFLKVQLHAHSSGSYDARTPPEDVLRFYASRGYDLVVITDHDRVTRAEPPEGMLVALGVELTQNAATCAPPALPGYRCLFHTGALFVDPARDASKQGNVALGFRHGRFEAYATHLAWAEAHGAVPVLNHPLFHFAADARLVSKLAKRGLRLLELVNAALDAQHPAGREAAERRAEALWDAVLSGGSTVYGVATDDAHHFDDAAERTRAGKHPYEGDKAWIMVDSSRDVASARSAILEGRFYATTGVSLSALPRGPGAIEVRVDDTEGPVAIRFVGQGGRVLARTTGIEARYDVVGTEGYVRAVVEAPSGAKAWTQPVRVP